MNCFKLDRLILELTRSQVCPPKPYFQPMETPWKSPNLEPVQPEIGWNLAQIWKNWTSNSSKYTFVYQNRSINPPEPSKPTLVLRCHLVKRATVKKFSIKEEKNGWTWCCILQKNITVSHWIECIFVQKMHCAIKNNAIWVYTTECESKFALLSEIALFKVEYFGTKKLITL